MTGRPAGIDTRSPAAIVATATVIVLPYLIPSAYIPKSEDLEFTTIPSILLVQQWLGLNVPTWSFSMGLGGPWPIPLGLGHTPMGALFSTLPAMAATGVIVWMHLVAMGIAGWFLARHLGVAAIWQPVCILSVMLAPALEYLYWSDAPTVFVSAALMPVLLALLVCVLELRGTGRVAATLGLALAGGIALREGHVGVLSIYALGFAIFAVSQPKALLRALPYLLAATLAGTLVAAEQLYVLARETGFFPRGVPREQQGLWWGIEGIVWGLFLRPGFLPSWEALSDLKLLASEWTVANKTVRTVGFGTIFAILVLVYHPTLWRLSRARPYILTFWGAFACVLAPHETLPTIFSATWPIRDLFNILGVLLAGVVLTRLGAEMPGRAAWLAGSQAAIVVAAAVPAVFGAAFEQRQGIYRTSDYNAVADPSKPTPYVAALRAAVGAGRGIDARFMVTSQVASLLQYEVMVDMGAINNVSILHGLGEVSFIAKGLSYDTIRWSQAVPYGQIAGERLQGRVSKDPFDWPRDDQDLLRLLGIRAVVATTAEPIGAASLRSVATLRGEQRGDLTIYRNEAYLPPAFFVPSARLDAPLETKPACPGASLVCLEVGSVVAAAETGIDVTTTQDRMELTFTPSPRGRSILLSVMHRPEWKASGGRLSAWNGLMRLDIDPGIASVRLAHEPTMVRSLRILSMAALASVLIALAMSVLALAPGRSATSGRPSGSRRS